MEETFWDSNGDWISAAITLLIAFALAFIVDRFVIARATRVASRVSETTVSRAATTRLRMVRRLVFVVIIIVGLGIALSQFDKLNRLANAVLASSAVVGPGARLRRAEDPRQPARRDPARDLAADPDRRLGDDRGRDRPGRRPHPLAHVHRHRRRAPGDRPQRDRGHQRGRQPLDRQPQRPGDGLASGYRPTPTSLGRARRSRRSSRRRSTSPRSRRTGCGSRSTGRGGRAARAPSGEEAALRERAQRALREAGVLLASNLGATHAHAPVRHFAARYPYRFAMTARQRRRHRAAQGGSVGKKILLGARGRARARRRSRVGGAGALGPGHPRRRRPRSTR